MGFKFLKRLFLSDIILSDKLIEELIGGCLLLEELEIVACSGFSPLHISSSMNLVRLTIHECWISHKLEIDGPNLLWLSISDVNDLGSPEYSLRNMSSLNYANIDLKFWFEWESGECKPPLNLEMLLEDLGHTKALELSSPCIQALSLWELRNRHLPISKRKRLILQTGLNKWELPGIANLLRTSPDLEILVIKIVRSNIDSFDEELMHRYDFDEGRYWESLKSSCTCLVHHLKNVKMLDFMGGALGSSSGSKVVRSNLNKQEKKINLVRFLLQNALVLEKMAIHIFDKPQFMKVVEWQQILQEVTQKILAFPRASSCAEVLVSYK
ncbi:putative F-box protein At1g60180 [Tasmannia lanceolata]|uniref:putative F-box protein At1g60180 n=1 Tax=Tasmannia lanceolata TaxID=3420 RepID=UPI00406432DC